MTHFAWANGLNRSRGKALRQAAHPMPSWDGASSLEIEGFNHLSQDRSTPMTEQAISLLRKRMIEDMGDPQVRGENPT
jgi:hypothetical protein